MTAFVLISPLSRRCAFCAAAAILLLSRQALGAGAISVGDVRRNFFSGETVSLTSVSVTLDNVLLSSATLMAQIELSAATVARTITPCPMREGQWSGHVNLAIPPLDRRVGGNLLLRVSTGDRVVARAEFPIHLYPPRDRFRRDFAGRRFALLDPKRTLEPILKFNKIEFSPVEPWQLSQSPDLPLLIGRGAMSDWSRRDADHWRNWLERGGQAVVFAQQRIPISEFDVRRTDEEDLSSKPVAMLFHTPLARALREGAPHHWIAPGWSDVPLPLPRAKSFAVLALAEPFDPHACCRVVEVVVGKGRAVFIQCAVDRCYEDEPGARVLWDALLEECLRPVSESRADPRTLSPTQPPHGRGGEGGVFE